MLAVTDRETGRSRGFGFVTFEDPAAASDAISEMDGQELEGRSISVTEAQEKLVATTTAVVTIAVVCI